MWHVLPKGGLEHHKPFCEDYIKNKDLWDFKFMALQEEAPIASEFWEPPSETKLFRLGPMYYDPLIRDYIMTSPTRAIRWTDTDQASPVTVRSNSLPNVFVGF